MPLDIIDEIRPKKEQRQTFRERVLFLFGAICLVVLLLIAVAWSTKAHAAPKFEADSEGGVRVVLHDEPCALDAVTNLPYRVVWHEGGQKVEGCWGPRPDAQVAVAYFADKTVALIPFGDIRPVQGV